MKQIGCLLGLVVLLSTSCKNRASKVQCGDALTELPAGAAQKASKGIFDIGHISMKAKATFKDKNGEQSVTINLKMVEDSSLWASISAFGIEAVRILVEGDSVKMINRLQNKYFVTTVDYLEQFTQQKFSLKQLQQTLVGNFLYDIEGYEKSNDALRADHLTYLEGFTRSIILLNGCFRPAKSELVEELYQRKVETNFSEYRKIKKRGTMPTHIEINATNGLDKVEITLDYVTINTDKISDLPFRIPDKYESGI